MAGAAGSAQAPRSPVPGPALGGSTAWVVLTVGRLGSAIGVVDVGAFLGTLIAVVGIGLILQVTTPAGSTDYTTASFKWAFSIQYVLWAIGIVQTLRYRRRTIRALVEHDPEAYAGLRRGVHLAPPT